MKWNKYRLKTTTQAEDFVSGILMELGINGVQIEDNVQISQEDKEKQFIDYLADLPEDDGTNSSCPRPCRPRSHTWAFFRPACRTQIPFARSG